MGECKGKNEKDDELDSNLIESFEAVVTVIREERSEQREEATVEERQVRSELLEDSKHNTNINKSRKKIALRICDICPKANQNYLLKSGRRRR